MNQSVSSMGHFCWNKDLDKGEGNGFCKGLDKGLGKGSGKGSGKGFRDTRYFCMWFSWVHESLQI